ncbi:MAG: cyclic pyranopterin monophosphate synthase MoaC [Treponema sp.]|nr:cyclic pyranopterin monophosphate synthase MoaC [Treponema sp.]
MRKRLNHINGAGEARMVDVGKKPDTRREALAQALLSMEEETVGLILEGALPKGDVIGTARIAGIMAAKKTAELIPLCHPIPLDSVELDIERQNKNQLLIKALVRTTWHTGVEMEALCAVSVAALTIYDMCKSVDKGMEIGEIRLLRKTGGKSGAFERGKEKT